MGDNMFFCIFGGIDDSYVVGWTCYDGYDEFYYFGFD